MYLLTINLDDSASWCFFGVDDEIYGAVIQSFGGLFQLRLEKGMSF